MGLQLMQQKTRVIFYHDTQYERFKNKTTRIISLFPIAAILNTVHNIPPCNSFLITNPWKYENKVPLRFYSKNPAWIFDLTTLIYTVIACSRHAALFTSLAPICRCNSITIGIGTFTSKRNEGGLRVNCKIECACTAKKLFLNGRKL